MASRRVTQHRQGLYLFCWVSLSLNTNLQKHIISQAFHFLSCTEKKDTLFGDGLLNSEIFVNMFSGAIVKTVSPEFSKESVLELIYKLDLKELENLGFGGLQRRQRPMDKSSSNRRKAHPTEAFNLS